MSNWIIVNKNITTKGINKYDKFIELNHDYCFSFTLNSSNYFYDQTDLSGIFVFGFFVPRLKSILPDASLKTLYSFLVKDKYSINELIKGCYTIILVQNGNFTIFNDPLGLSKFFYTTNNKTILFSDELKKIKDIIKPSISSNAVLQYYVFNYQLNGDTFFDGISYSQPASCFNLKSNGRIDLINYFNIHKFLSMPIKKLKKQDVFEQIGVLWMDIITQWQQMFNSRTLSLTLTSGLDSRILLGSFLKVGYTNFDTFTFGQHNSSDVYYANLLAEKFQIPHKHLYPDLDFFEHFDQKAEMVFSKGQSFVSIYRAHRLEAYQNVMNTSNAIFMGLAGSDLVRGIGYDGLIVTPIAYHCWEKNSLESFFQNQSNIEHLQGMGFNDFSCILDRQDQYSYISHPMNYLFKVIIPLHFGQDILMNSNMGWKTIVPFLDMDYISFLRQTHYFGVEEYENYKTYNYHHRLKGLYYSARLAQTIYKPLANFTLGKGYTPNDVVKSPLFAVAKSFFHKRAYKTKFTANFDYGVWYWEYLRNFFNQNSSNDIGINQGYLNKCLTSVEKYGGEYHFLDFTKAVNLILSSKI